MPVNIAIDGPSGAGKSSAAKALAKKLGYLYIDTGALYRAIGLFCIRENVADMKDVSLVVPQLEKIDVSLRFVEGEQRVYLNGEDVSGVIRTQPVAQAASDVSAHPPVRAFLLDLQRKMAAENNVLMDGRDIGTVILPNADVKFFLTADAAARAKRRTLELQAKGIAADYETVLREIEQRDANDSSRAAAPLKAADDAVLVDNSQMDQDQTVEYMCQIIEEKLG
jgi:cytidylate kinase